METSVQLVFGIRGTGKSYFVKHYVIPKHKRRIIYDTQGEYNDGIIFEDFAKLKEFWARCAEKDFKLIYRPIRHDHFLELCDLVYLCGNMAFIVEELDLTAGTYDNDIEFLSLIKRGRHRNVEIIGVSQRPFGINRNITSQAKEIYSFCQKEPRDIDYLRYYLGESAELIRHLKNFHFYYWEYRNAQGYKILVLNGTKIQEITNEYPIIKDEADLPAGKTIPIETTEAIKENIEADPLTNTDK
jgi:hypothetical protein